MLQNVRLCPTDSIPNPTYYVQALQGEFSNWAFCERRAPQFKGIWRSEVFSKEEGSPLDLEIGTGNGYHFAHYASSHKDRSFIGIEWKYKPLIQSIRRALNDGVENARILRYDASFLQHLFGPEELNNVLIHFPDPWSKKRQKKHRLISDPFLEVLYSLQRSGSELEFKTDNRNYFDWAVEHFDRSQYERTSITYDLHNSEFQESNFITHFEKIFLAQGLPIHRITLAKA